MKLRPKRKIKKNPLDLNSRKTIQYTYESHSAECAPVVIQLRRSPSAPSHPRLHSPLEFVYTHHGAVGATIVLFRPTRLFAFFVPKSQPSYFSGQINARSFFVHSWQLISKKLQRKVQSVYLSHHLNLFRHIASQRLKLAKI